MCSYKLRARRKAVLMSVDWVRLSPPANSTTISCPWLCEIHSIPWPIINSHFRDTLANRFYIPRISCCHPPNSCQYPSSCPYIGQPIKPLNKYLRLMDLEHDGVYPNGYIVSMSGNAMRLCHVERVNEHSRWDTPSLKREHDRMACLGSTREIMENNNILCC